MVPLRDRSGAVPPESACACRRIGFAKMGSHPLDSGLGCLQTVTNNSWAGACHDVAASLNAGSSMAGVRKSAELIDECAGFGAVGRVWG
jgi:hypothetical protein